MADEFNPQGVDQTPRNNETPDDTADAGNAEPKNPFVGGDSVDAGNASDPTSSKPGFPGRPRCRSAAYASRYRHRRH